MSDLVGNPEDRFSHIAAHMLLVYLYGAVIQVSGFKKKSAKR